jgi:hypothetical protein
VLAGGCGGAPGIDWRASDDGRCMANFTTRCGPDAPVAADGVGDTLLCSPIGQIVGQCRLHVHRDPDKTPHRSGWQGRDAFPPRRTLATAVETNSDNAGASGTGGRAPRIAIKSAPAPFVGIIASRHERISVLLEHRCYGSPKRQTIRRSGYPGNGRTPLQHAGKNEIRIKSAAARAL